MSRLEVDFEPAVTRPVTPLPRPGRWTRNIKRGLTLLLLPPLGALADLERALRGFSSRHPDRLWPYRQAPRRILVVRLDLLGDLILTLHLVDALKRRFPGATITFLARRGSGELLGLSPQIDSVIECDAADLFHLAGIPRPDRWRSVWGLLGRIRSARFDLAISAYGPLARSLVALSLARHRVGDGNGFPALDRSRAIAPGEHEICHLAALVEAGPADNPAGLIEPGQTDAAFAGVRPVVLSPGARSGSAKSWPAEYWRELAVALAGRQIPVVVIGTAEQSRLTEAIAGGVGGVTDLGGRLAIGELAGLLDNARLVISVDSMPLHLADLCGTRTIGLFGPTDVARYRPRGTGSMALASGVACAPCYDQRAPPICPFGDRLCMRWLEPRAVLDAAGALDD